MPKIIFNGDGLPIGIGEDGTQITDAQWQEFLNNAGKRKWNGSAVVEYVAPFDEAACTSQIKSIAGQVIIAIAPEYKQRNMTAAALRIENKQRLGTSTVEEDATADAIIAIWGKIESIRTKSDELEAQYIAAGNDLTAQDLEIIKAALIAAGE